MLCFSKGTGGTIGVGACARALGATVFDLRPGFRLPDMLVESGFVVLGSA